MLCKMELHIPDCSWPGAAHLVIKVWDYLLYLRTRRWHERGIEVLPLKDALPGLAKLL